MGYTLQGRGATEATIGALDIGISKEGMAAYRDALKAELITKCKEKLEATDGITTTLVAGWQGEARDKFLKQLGQTITKIEEDLEDEYYDLEARLYELESNYFDQDMKMMED